MSKLNTMLSIWCKQQRYDSGCYEPPKHRMYRKNISHTSLLGIRCYQIPCEGCAWNPASNTPDMIRELEDYAKQMDSIQGKIGQHGR